MKLEQASTAIPSTPIESGGAGNGGVSKIRLQLAALEVVTRDHTFKQENREFQFTLI